MKPEHVSPTLLILIYCILVIVGVRNLLFEQASLMSILGLAANLIILSALLVISVRWALAAGIFFCWVKMGLGVVLVLLGAWEVITLDLLDGLLMIAIGSTVAIGLAYWTLLVLRTIERDSAVAEG